MKGRVLTGIALITLSSAAQGSVLTYDFTGTVTSATGIYSSLQPGTEVTGTYTFNYDAALSTGGMVGSQAASWGAVTQTGTAFGTPADYQYIFSSTLQAGGLSYSTDPTLSQGYSNVSSVLASLENRQIVIGEASIDAMRDAAASSLDLIGGGTPWDSNGVPDLAAATTLAQGRVILGPPETESDLVYNITSITPVPIPAADWLLLSGLSFGALARRRGGLIRAA